MNKRISLFGAIVMVALGLVALQNKGADAPSPAAQADSPQQSEDAVRAAFTLFEKAVHEGDAALWFSLQSGKALAQIDDAQKDSFRKFFHASPEIHYVPLAVRANASHGIVSCRIDRSSPTTPGYEIMKFVQENGAWKIDEESFSDSAPDPRALSALLPPSDGAFIRAGSRWTSVPYAEANTKFFKDDELDWKMQATRDESFLYIRFEAKAPLPAPGKEVYEDNSAPGKPVRDGGPPPPPIMKIKINSGSGEQELNFQANDAVQTRATFDEKGHAASNRFFVDYMLTLRDGADTVIFSNDTNDTFSPLVAVNDRFLNLKIPLKSLGLEKMSSPKIEIEEANSLAKILPYQVAQDSP